MFLFILTRVKEVIDSLGGMEIYGSPLANRVNISRLLAHVMVHYGVSPLFKVIVLPRGKIGVSILFAKYLSKYGPAYKMLCRAAKVQRKSSLLPDTKHKCTM